MSAYASQAMISLKPCDFKKHIPQPVSEDQVTGTTIDRGQNNVLERILLSVINEYRKMRSKYCEQMHSMYGIIHGNLDQNIHAPRDWLNIH